MANSYEGYGTIYGAVTPPDEYVIMNMLYKKTYHFKEILVSLKRTRLESFYLKALKVFKKKDFN